MSLLPKFISRFNMMPVIMLVPFGVEIYKLTRKHIWKCKGPITALYIMIVSNNMWLIKCTLTLIKSTILFLSYTNHISRTKYSHVASGYLSSTAQVFFSLWKVLLGGSDPEIQKATLEKNNKTRGLILADFKTYYKDTVVFIVNCGICIRRHRRVMFMTRLGKDFFNKSHEAINYKRKH